MPVGNWLRSSALICLLGLETSCVSSAVFNASMVKPELLLPVHQIGERQSSEGPCEFPWKKCWLQSSKIDPNSSQQHKKSRIALAFNQQRRKLRTSARNILLIWFKAHNPLHLSPNLGAGLDPFQRSLHLFLSTCS